jgi:hypothetical protein
MDVNKEYEPILKQAVDMQYHFKDLLGHENPTATILHQEMNHLVDDIKEQKNPRDVDERIRTIQNQMYQVEHQGQNLMSYEHASGIHHDFQRMREQVRHFGNYN